MNWSDLSMSQRSELMQIYLKNGITSLDEMKKHYNNFAEGGNIDDPPKGGFIINNYRAKNSKTYKERAAASEKAMFTAWRGRDSRRNFNSSIEAGGPMQNSFLLSGSDKDRYMLEHGYLLGERGDYGLVNKAVGENNYQVYQTQADEADRNYLVPIGNVNNTWFGRANAELQHAGAYPSTIYIDGRNPENFYQKAWDLNNYDNPLDWFGYPAVQTTGFSKIKNPKSKKASITVDNETRKRHVMEKSPMDFFNEYLKQHNLNREVLDDGAVIYALPTVHVKPYTFANGGKLDIPPERFFGIATPEVTDNTVYQPTYGTLLPEVKVNVERPSWQHNLTDYDIARLRSGQISSETAKSIAQYRATGTSEYMKDVNKLAWLPNGAMALAGGLSGVLANPYLWGAIGLGSAAQNIEDKNYGEAALDVGLTLLGPELRLLNKGVEATRFGKSARIASELNKAVKSTRLQPRIAENPVHTRFKLGDVELNDPNLMYHADNGDFTGFSGNGAYVKDNMLFPGKTKQSQESYSWWNLGSPYRTGQSRLLVTTKDNPNFIKVRDQNYPIGQWDGNKGFVTNSEYVSSNPIRVGNQYVLEPGYGYRKYSNNPNTLPLKDVLDTKISLTQDISKWTPEQWTAAQDAAIAKGIRLKKDLQTMSVLHPDNLTVEDRRVIRDVAGYNGYDVNNAIAKLRERFGDNILTAETAEKIKKVPENVGRRWLNSILADFGEGLEATHKSNNFKQAKKQIDEIFTSKNPSIFPEFLDKIKKSSINKTIQDEVDNQVLSRLLLNKSRQDYINNYSSIDEFIKNYEDALNAEQYIVDGNLYRAGSQSGGIYIPTYNRIVLPTDTPKRYAIHETRHAIDNYVGLMPDEENLLKAYGSIKPDERISSNAEVRSYLLDKYNATNYSIAEQNKIIDNVSDNELFDLMNSSNKYLQDAISDGTITKESIPQIKQALKYVGILSTPLMLNNEYSNGGKIFIKPENRGKLDIPPYTQFLNTLPDNLKNSGDEYNMRRYWELNNYPKDFNEGIQLGMFTKQDDGYHANSVVFNPNTNSYEFMKDRNHPTYNMELDWYYSDAPEAVEFRKKYKYTPGIGMIPDQYTPRR